MTYILSLDDFCEDEFQGAQFDRIDLLFRLKSKLPRLKVSLFTILAKSSLRWIHQIQKIPWIDMIPHGWHHTAGECAHWTKQDALAYLDKIEFLNLTKGFKAPGWRISTPTYHALLKRGYWVADLQRNHDRRPAALPAYISDQDPQHRITGHMNQVNGDPGLQQNFHYYTTLSDANFQFIKDII